MAECTKVLGSAACRPLSLILLVVGLVGLATPSLRSDDAFVDPDPYMGKGLPPPKHTASVFPFIDYGIHLNGKLWTTINNNGVIGNLFNFSYRGNSWAPSFYHPQSKKVQHGYWSALWVGGIKGVDTLVSVAMDLEYNYWDRSYPIEFWPDIYPFGAMETRSNMPNSEYYHPDAKADLEFHATYYDTCDFEWWVPRNTYDQRKHRPLGIEVKQTSYSWAFDYASDLILVDFEINNLTADTIYDVWLGQYYRGCVRYRSEFPYPPSDDVAGYIYSVEPELEGCEEQLLRIAYCLDADGYANSFRWYAVNTPSAFGIAPMRLPDEFAVNNFNWWTNSWTTYFNWGPRKSTTAEYPLRKFSLNGLGAPYSDLDKYYIMSKPEIDYSGYEVAIDHSGEGWLPPPEFAEEIAEGHLPEFVTSYGPKNLNPYGTLHLTIALVVGEDVHWNPDAYPKLYRSDKPKRFLDQLDWSNLINNVRWARRIYDNPGVDTDGDGDSGTHVTFIDPQTLDTITSFCSGDGVPDFRGAAPPPPPDVRVYPEKGKIRLRWNGRYTENFFDPFSAVKDFEGYRVYISRSDREEEAVMLASFDHINFNRWQWDRRKRRFIMKDLPFSLDTLHSMYGEDFDPLAYSAAEPYIWREYIFYFEPVDYNQSDLTDVSLIHKVYPDAEFDLNDLNEEGFVRYYEYEFVIKDLLPSVPYWVSVTALDFGHPPEELGPLESSPAANMVKVFAMDQAPDVLADGKLDVFCYPNPYRIDGAYIGNGYENRKGDRWYERTRAIRFGNLPDRCTISIYSLDGDLVDKVTHDEPPGSGTASIAEWDLISRNNQAIMTGLYYWVVESEFGQQIGKLVIIK